MDSEVHDIYEHWEKTTRSIVFRGSFLPPHPPRLVALGRGNLGLGKAFDLE
jgi:hypothetical protein